jgi:hypothetical protein
MSKPKGGLQKRVSSIFDGVPLEAESARPEIRHPDKPVAPASSMPSAPVKPVPAANPPAKPAAVPSSPIASAPSVLAPKAPAVPPVTTQPAAWPKAPAVQPETPKQPAEQKPRISLATAMAADAPAAPAAPKIPMNRPETPQRQAERPSATPRVMPKVIVKKSASTDKRKTGLLVAALAVVFVLVLAWRLGAFSSGAATVPSEAVNPQTASILPTKITWQRPASSPAVRNPMRLGSGPISAVAENTSSTPVLPKGAYTVAATSLVNGVWRAMIDGQYVKVNDMAGAARVVAITANYVDLEFDGKVTRSFINVRGKETGSTDVTPDADSQSLK